MATLVKSGVPLSILVFEISKPLSPVDINLDKNLKIIKLKVKTKLIGMIVDRQYLNLCLCEERSFPQTWKN